MQDVSPTMMMMMLMVTNNMLKFFVAFRSTITKLTNTSHHKPRHGPRPQPTSAEQNILHRRVPHHKSHASLMSHQVDHGFFQVSNQSFVRNLPDLHGTVLRSAGDNIVVVRTPLDIENSCFVTNDQWCIAVDSPCLKVTTVQCHIFGFILIRQTYNVKIKSKFIQIQ